MPECMCRKGFEKMKALTNFIYEDMQPAFGVTEPAAIAYCVAVACSYCSQKAEKVVVRLNSGMYKNAFSCGIPKSEYVGSLYAAALGIVAKSVEKKLEILEDITPEEEKEANCYASRNCIEIQCAEFTSTIFIEAEVFTKNEHCIVTIREKHTNITKIEKDGKVLFTNSNSVSEKEQKDIHDFSLQQIWDYAAETDVEELRFIEKAFQMNMELLKESLASEKTVYAKILYKKNKEQIISEEELSTAQLLCNAAIEGRVLGIQKAAMSITGSGSHGIICTMPLYAVYLVRKKMVQDREKNAPETKEYSWEQLLRATALSYLVTMYIKEYSGRLSAFCGCGIAAGTGMACGLLFLKGGNFSQMQKTINNMASGITGMICHGGNHGCAVKGMTAVDAAFRAATFALEDIGMEDIHGICGETPEETCKNMGLIASPGMVETEKTILSIMKSKGN